MRKVIISLLLAGAAASPALAAQNVSDTDRQQQREERAQAREQRQQAHEQTRSERPANVEHQSFNNNQSSGRPDHQDRQVQQQQLQQQQQQSLDRQARIQERNDARDARRDSADAARTERIENRQQVVEQIRDRRDLRQSTRETPPVLHTRVPVVSNVPREGTQPPPPAQVRPASQPHWSISWRNNSKYDWQNYRHHHHSWFHLGFYYDPFGWGYQPYQIGWRLWPSYYSSQYWLNDPWQYRLPYAPAGTQWVRYYNDAVLVDTWSGQVVDVIYNFFW